MAFQNVSSHKNILPVKDIRYERGFLYMVTPKCDKTLNSFMIRSGPLSEAQAAELFGQICEGVLAVHMSNLIHCDLKPENFFMRGGTVLLADFDLSSIRLTLARSGSGEESSSEMGNRLCPGGVVWGRLEGCCCCWRQKPLHRPQATTGPPQQPHQQERQGGLGLGGDDTDEDGESEGEGKPGEHQQQRPPQQPAQVIVVYILYSDGDCLQCPAHQQDM
ncbi:unnamed protein product [Vitrella brassicaformis CCMP3155]|uniref:non-specific serine/threonine protein kinase n=1 Tax=Vitrella brassicaformis (strain CCMP3155) TaxID=1169540 RepID=A0A0G4EBZ3_VITBC|nr:unnamed protein product [Vitrella brassicaformis CCMP3155]|eukprot:CEL93510.1 unnamed protein product [Vitrella brassicaformis CCMP3155]